MPHEGLLEPRYDAAGLAGVLPGVAASLGVSSLAASMPCPCVPPGAPWSCWSTASATSCSAPRRPRALPALAAARGIPHHGGVLHHGHLHGHLRHRPAAGRPRPARVRGAGAGEDRLLNELSGRTGRTPGLADPADGVRGRSGGRRGGHAHRARVLRRLRAHQAALRAAGSARPASRRGSTPHLAARRPALARLPLLGRPRQGRSRPRLPVVEATSSRRSTPSWSAGALGPVGHRGLHHGRPRHGRRAARPAHRHRPRRRARRRDPARRESRARCSSTASRVRPPTSWPPGGSGSPRPGSAHARTRSARAGSAR